MVVSGHSVENQGELTDETTDNRDNGLLLAAKAINISNFLVDNALFDFAFLNELLINRIPEFCTQISALSGLTLLAALNLGSLACLFLLLCLLLGVIALLVMSSDGGLVVLRLVIDESIHHSVVKSISLVELVQEGLSLFHEPGEHISL